MLESKHQREKRRLVLAVFFVIISISSITLTVGNIGVNAGSLTETSFTVRPILPENQERQESTFFDLRMEPGQEQLLYVEVTNHTHEAIEVTTKVFTATTNRNGFAEYQLSPEIPDSTLPFLMEDIIEVPASIEIPPYGVAYIPVQINMPGTSYNGVLAAGLEMKRAPKEEEGTGGIRNIYSFLTVVLLHQGEAVSPQIISHGTEIEFTGREGIFSTNFQNIAGAFTRGLEVQTVITNRQTKEVIFESREEGLQMVPHSNFSYQIKVGEEEFSEGIYILDYVLKSDQLRWEFREIVRIRGERSLEGYTLSKSEVFLERGNPLWTIVSLFFLMVFPVIYIVFYRTKSRKNLSRG